MTDVKISPQPGPIFYDTFVGVLRVFGTNLKEWCESEGVHPSNAKMAAVGGWNGPKAHALRAKMIATVGPDLFNTLYHGRMARERGTAA